MNFIQPQKENIYSLSTTITHQGPFLLAWLTLTPAWTSNYINYKVWGEITYLFPNFNASSVEIYDWISDFIPPFIGHVITYPWWD